jgi:hypothetical protein
MTLTTADLVDRAQNGRVDEIDPAARPKRRTFTAAEKHAHLDAYDALAKGSETCVPAPKACTRRISPSGANNATGPGRHRRRGG